MVERKRSLVSKSTQDVMLKSLEQSPNRQRAPSLREINFEKQRLAKLEENSYTGMAANMHKSPLRIHEE